MEIREIAHGSGEYVQACELRDELLRRPIGLSLFDEDLAAETGFTHLVGVDGGGQVVAYLQLKPLDHEVMKMQQVVVTTRLQGGGFGKALMEFAEAHCRAAGIEKIVLHARESVVGFYESIGYRCVDEPFVELGIAHRKAQKLL
jgi:predicted GNAT family N-acyltransferase